MEAETGTLVCKQRQDNTIVPHSQLVVDKQEHVWRTLPQTLHQHNLVVLEYKRRYCQISNYSLTARQHMTVSETMKTFRRCTTVRLCEVHCTHKYCTLNLGFSKLRWFSRSTTDAFRATPATRCVKIYLVMIHFKVSTSKAEFPLSEFSYFKNEL